MVDMNLMHDLNLARALDALLTTRSVSVAARRLGVTQSAMSHTLARLRDALGDPLLVRAGRGMVPTVRAEAIATRLRAALEALDAALAPASFDPATARRTFVIGTSDYAEFVLLPSLLARLAAEAPGVDVWVRRQKDSTAHELSEGDTDVVIGPLLADDTAAGLRSRALFRERFVVLVRRDHPLARAPLTVDAWAEARHAFIAPGGGRGGVVDEALAAVGLERRVALALPHFLVAPYAVASSDLVLTVAERVAVSFAEHLPLTILEPPLPLPGFTMSMVWHERRDADPGHAWLRRLLSTVGPAAAPRP